MKNKIAFFGTPDFVVAVAESLAKASLAPSLVVTVPDKPKGRGLMLSESPVKTWAKENGIPVVQPEKPDADFAATLADFDLFVVAGYGKILPKELLEKPSRGVLNVHPSLLPAYRGPSPIESQILADEKTVGVSVILLDIETDHGPVLAQKSFPLSRPMKRNELETLLWKEGGDLLADSIPPYLSGMLAPKEQDHASATYTPKLSKDDGLLDLSRDGYANYLKYCAYEGWPGTYFFAERNGKKMRVKITDAAWENDSFRILKVIPEGKREMAYADFERAS
jgi:methionyl-tRNA formyltransferase